jgi:hypothetical protein
MDVRRHVFEMPGGRHHAGEPFRRRDPLARFGGGFHRVNIIVIGAGVMRVFREHAFEDGDDFLRPRGRLAVQCPKLPGVEVHQRLGGHHLDIAIVREALGDGFHRVGIGSEDWSFGGRVERLRIRVALRDRVDQRPLDRRRLACMHLRLLQRLPGDCGSRRRHHRQVIVGADGQRDAPPAHRALRIERCRFGEGTRRLVVVEGPEEAHTLIEKSQRLRRIGADRAVEIAQAAKQLGQLGPLFRRLRYTARRLRRRGAERRRAGRRRIAVRRDARETKNRCRSAAKHYPHRAHDIPRRETSWRNASPLRLR